MPVDRLETLLLLLVVTSLMLYVVLTPGAQESTGQVFSSFNSTATIVEIAYDYGNRNQSPMPFTNAGNVNFSIPLSITDMGRIFLTVPKPTGYENGFDWFMTENGEVVNVTASSENIEWFANTSATTILHFSVLAPFLTVDFNDRGAYNYTKQVRAGSENPFFNVTATTNISDDYENYRLYLVDFNLTDVTELYNLTLNATNATWTGFNLSTKIFWLRGNRSTPLDTGTSTTTTTTSSGGGGGGGGGGGASLSTYPTNTSTNQSPEVIYVQGGFQTDLDWLDLILQVGELRIINITISNNEQKRERFVVAATRDFFDIYPGSFSLDPKESKTIEIKIQINTPGDFPGRIIIGNYDWEQQVYFDITVLPVKHPEPLPEAPENLPDLDSNLFNFRSVATALLLIFGLIILIIKLTIKKEEQKPVTYTAEEHKLLWGANKSSAHKKRNVLKKKVRHPKR